MRDKPPARRRRVFASFLLSKRKATLRRGAARVCAIKEEALLSKENLRFLSEKNEEENYYICRDFKGL